MWQILWGLEISPWNINKMVYAPWKACMAVRSSPTSFNPLLELSNFPSSETLFQWAAFFSPFQTSSYSLPFCHSQDPRYSLSVCVCLCVRACGRTMGGLSLTLRIMYCFYRQQRCQTGRRECLHLCVCLYTCIYDARAWWEIPAIWLLAAAAQRRCMWGLWNSECGFLFYCKLGCVLDEQIIGRPRAWVPEVCWQWQTVQQSLLVLCMRENWRVLLLVVWKDHRHIYHPTEEKYTQKTVEMSGFALEQITKRVDFCSNWPLVPVFFFNSSSSYFTLPLFWGEALWKSTLSYD